MVASRKRARQEDEISHENGHEIQEPSTLDRVRGMWDFAALVQWIYIFGPAVKIDENLAIEDIEAECSKPQSPLLCSIGLALLKFVSSHRGLTPELFDEYTRRQFLAKAPARNPFGTDEVPHAFDTFDVFTKIRVLQQLTQWTMIHPERLREKMEEQRDTQQTAWRIEPYGWDSEEREYYVLDDNRLYRKTFAPLQVAPAKPKKNSKKAKAALRASKRRRLSSPGDVDVDADTSVADAAVQDDGFGGAQWECIAITLSELNAFISTIAKTRDANQIILRDSLQEHLLPILEKQEESQKRKAALREREMLNLEKLATAKRSSRIAGKQEQHRQEQEALEADRKHQAELAMAKKEQQRWERLEFDRESRIATREQRLREREARRILHEEELANLSEDNKKLEAGQGRLSERHLKAEIKKKQDELQKLAEEEEDWVFDCICGVYGQEDDGTHSIACDECGIWQHSKCLGVSEVDAEREDFHFTCATCKRRAEDAELAKAHGPIKIKILRPGLGTKEVATKPEVIIPTSQSTAPDSMGEHRSPQLKKSAMPVMHTFQTNVSPQSSPPQYKHDAMTVEQTMPTTASGSSSSKPQYTMPVESLPLAGRNGVNGSTTAHTQQVLAQMPVAGSTESAIRAHSSSTYSASSKLGLNGEGLHSPPARQGSPTRQYQMPTTTDRVIPGNATSTTTPRPAYAGMYVPSRISYDQRKGSLDHSSPSFGGALLTPANNHHMPAVENRQTATPSLGAFLTQSVQLRPQGSSQAHDLDLPASSSALPPASTGISPTKQSPPRAGPPMGSTPGGYPTVLPPVAPLTPTPQIQNFAPPVKSSPPGPNVPLGSSNGTMG